MTGLGVTVTVTDLLVTLALVLLFRWLLAQLRMRGPPRYPPGPPTVPLLGSLPFLPGRGVEKFVSEYVASFGPVTGLKTGSYHVAMINDWALAKQLFSKEEFSGRLCNFTTRWARSVGGTNQGIVFTDGPLYHSQKHFMVKQLRNFGFGKTSLETVMVEQANLLTQHLEANTGKVLVNNELFATPIVNVLWSMMAGTTFKRDDAKAQSILKDLAFIFSSKILIVALMFPWVRFVLPGLTNYSRRLRILAKMRTYFGDLIAAHSAELQEDCPRDFMDAFLAEMRSSARPEFSASQLTMLCFDLFGAGSDTSSSTLSWALLHLALHPAVQERCHQEAAAVLGPGEEPRLEHGLQLHYCQAVIAEVQRLGQVAVTSVMHRLTTEYTLPSGHVLPKDCLVQSNIKKFMMDPELWNDPDTFDPDRFLDASGRFSKPEYFVPFGHGKRMCLGEPLARAELFIFFVSLVRRLRFEAAPGHKLDPDQYTAGFTKSPNDFIVQVTKR